MSIDYANNFGNFMLIAGLRATIYLKKSLDSILERFSCATDLEGEGMDSSVNRE
jgi:hypothetical protein